MVGMIPTPKTPPQNLVFQNSFKISHFAGIADGLEELDYLSKYVNRLAGTGFGAIAAAYIACGLRTKALAKRLAKPETFLVDNNSPSYSFFHLIRTLDILWRSLIYGQEGFKRAVSKYLAVYSRDRQEIVSLFEKSIRKGTKISNCTFGELEEKSICVRSSMYKGKFFVYLFQPRRFCVEESCYCRCSCSFLYSARYPWSI
jgi:predicted acylesterase/phospholipase RssA